MIILKLHECFQLRNYLLSLNNAGIYQSIQCDYEQYFYVYITIYLYHKGFIWP